MKKNNKKQQKSHYHGKYKKENMKEHVMKPKDAVHDFTTVTCRHVGTWAELMQICLICCNF